MQIKLLFSRWTQVAGIFIFGGALAWMLKLYVIISTNGQVINTGASAVFMRIGLLLLFIGSTGIGNRLSLNRALILRIIAIVLSPAIVFGSFFLFAAITGPLFKNSSIWYAQQEAPIALAVVVYMTTGLALYRSYRSTARLSNN